jgi:2'-5' RNA ligase
MNIFITFIADARSGHCHCIAGDSFFILLHSESEKGPSNAILLLVSPVSPLQSAVRIFVGLTPPDAILARLEQFERTLQAQMGFSGVSWQPPEKAHLTLYFLGHVASSRLPVLTADLSTACLDETPFEIHCSGQGAFPSLRHPKVFWVGFAGELSRLQMLRSKIAATCEPFLQTTDRESFNPHLTVALVKTGSPRELNRLSAAFSQVPFEPSQPWTIDSIELIASHLSPQGSRYERVGRIPFPP